MRILIHDFAGHPFQVQLSRALAARGHSVLHVWPEGLPGPKGALQLRPDDPPGFRVHPVPLSSVFRKYSPVRRMLAQSRYAAELRKLLDREVFDVVLSANTPIDVQAALLKHSHRRGIAFVHWVQDVYYEALRFFLRKRLGTLASWAIVPWRLLETRVSRNSDAIVAIAPAFLRSLQAMKVASSRIDVIENWAPLEDVRPAMHDNPWRSELALDGRPVFLYSGTLGIKHRPDLLFRLAEALGDKGQVVVVSEGVGRAYLDKMPKLDNLKLLDFQPWEHISDVLAAADVLVAALESDAGEFAVPSKILSYLCAGRPVLFASPHSNLAADVIRRSGAGVVVDPADVRTWTDEALKLACDPRRRETLGMNARRYAEQNFDIQKIAERFERVLTDAIQRPHQPRRVRAAVGAVSN